MIYPEPQTKPLSWVYVVLSALAWGFIIIGTTATTAWLGIAFLTWTKPWWGTISEVLAVSRFLVTAAVILAAVTVVRFYND